MFVTRNRQKKLYRHDQVRPSYLFIFYALTFFFMLNLPLHLVRFHNILKVQRIFSHGLLGSFPFLSANQTQCIQVTNTYSNFC